MASLLLLGGVIACGRGAERDAASAEESSAPGAQGEGAPSRSEAAEAPPAEPASPAAPPAPEADDDYSRRPAIEPNDTAVSKEKKLAPDTAPSDDLRAAESAFDRTLDAESLSCDSARPHRDAICEIAKRLCDLSVKTPSSDGRDDCVTANQACEKAQRKYQARCGK
jgi:hypothetical protein